MPGFNDADNELPALRKERDALRVEQKAVAELYRKVDAERNDLRSENQRLRAALEKIKFELEQNVGLDSEDLAENEKLDHRLLAFTAASTVYFREKALAWIGEALGIKE